jgi:hypothetical protein
MEDVCGNSFLNILLSIVYRFVHDRTRYVLLFLKSIVPSLGCSERHERTSLFRWIVKHNKPGLQQEFYTITSDQQLKKPSGKTAGRLTPKKHKL